MKKYVRSSKYTLYGEGDDIIAEGNNKVELIRKADQMSTPATLEDNYGIIYENIAQQKINNPTEYVKSETSATYDMYKNQILHESNPTKLVDILGRASDDSKISNYEYASLYKIALSNPAYPISEEEYLKNG